MDAMQHSDSDDTLSLTSTVEENDGDQDFPVQAILAEGKIDNQIMYLIEWQGYELRQATWEPREHLNDGLLQMWAENKRERLARGQTASNASKWKRASLEHLQSRLARHTARNAKRARLGLPQRVAEKDFNETIAILQTYPERDFIEAPLSAGVRPRSRDEAPRTATTASPKQGAVKRPLLKNVNATKTGSRKGTGVNVFLTGKIPKRRAQLHEVAVDPQKGSKMLNLRQQNIIHSRSKNRDGVEAPSHIPKQLILLGKNNSEQSETSQQTRTAPVQTHDNDEPMLLDSDELTTESSASKTNEATKTTTPVALKRKRSVQFIGEVVTESASGVCKSPPPISRNPSGSLPTDSHAEGNQTANNVAKSSRIGPSSALTNVSLDFELVPPNRDAPWVAAFKTTQELEFTHMCSAHAFGFKALTPKDRHVSGNISCSDHTVLANLTANLEQLASGAVCHCGDCLVLIFPGNCSSWKTVFEEKNIEIRGNSPLRYLILETDVNLPKSLLAAPKHTRREDHDRTSMSFFNRDLYQNLTDELVQPRESHIFFLAFPRQAAEEEHIVMQWLKLMNPSCEIRSGLMPGSWSSFVKEQRGIMIIHQSMSLTSYHFTHFHKLLHLDPSQFLCWSFDRPLRILPELSQDPEDDKETEDMDMHARTQDISDKKEIPDIQLKKLFPSGSAFLLTPSVLLAQPIASFKFVEWFFQKHIEKPNLLRHGKLVVSAGIEDWLFNLAMVKTGPNPRFADTKEENEARVKTWDRLRQMSRSGAENDMLSPIQFGPGNIDADDEQSLVNWFGFWSNLEAANLRRFWVVGSDDCHPDQMARLLRPVEYTAAQPSSERRASQAAQTMQGVLQLVRDDNGFEIEAALQNISSEVGTRPLLVYDKPVAWIDNEEPYHSFVHWFTKYRNKWLEPWITRASNSAKSSYTFRNTLLGFFHTRPNSSPEGTAAPRRPWIAVYRAKDPHRRPLKASQLFIWDEKLSSWDSRRTPCVTDLSPEQQELIRIVRGRSDLLPLESIWVGGFDSASIPYAHAVDKTLDCLRSFAIDFKEWLPAPETVIAQRGWKPLDTEPTSTAQQSTMTAPTELIDNMEGLAVDDGKIVFHPPNINHQRQDNLDNALFKWSDAQTASRPGKFVHQSTTSWYSRQVRNGQGFGHIRTENWRTVLEALNIPNTGRL